MADLYQNEPLDPTKVQQPQVDNLGTPGSYTLQDAQSRLNQWTTQQYGQTLNDQQWQQLGGAIGYTGGDVSQSMYDQAQGLIGQYAGQLGWSPVSQPTAQPTAGTQPAAQPTTTTTTQPTAATPAATGPDQQGIAQFQQWAQQTYGRPATDAELQQIATAIGYQGGAITPELMQRAQAEAARIAGTYGVQTPGVNPQPTTPAAPTPQQQQAQTTSQLQTVLQQLLAQNPGTVDPNSEPMRQQRGAFQRGQQRAMERARLAAAERANATGATGALEGDINRMNLTAAQQSGDFEAGMVGGELQAQRQQLAQAMQIAASMGQAAEARQLQERMNEIDATLRREGYGLQERLGRGQLGLGLLEAQLRNQQANNQLGFNYAQLGNQSNTAVMQSLIQALMGGRV